MSMVLTFTSVFCRHLWITFAKQREKNDGKKQLSWNSSVEHKSWSPLILITITFNVKLYRYLLLGKLSILSYTGIYWMLLPENNFTAFCHSFPTNSVPTKNFILQAIKYNLKWECNTTLRFKKTMLAVIIIIFYKVDYEQGMLSITLFSIKDKTRHSAKWLFTWTM